MRRPTSPRVKAAAGIVTVYVVAFLLALAVDVTASTGIGPAQHGPITPAPAPDGSYRE